MRDDAFAQLGDTDLSDLTPQGSSPDVRSHERRRRTEPGPDRPPGQRQSDGSLLPVPELRARRHDAARLKRRPDPERRLDRQLRLHHPRLGHRRGRRRRPAIALWAWPVRLRRRGRLEPPAPARPGTWDRLLRDRRDRDVGIRRPGRDRGPAGALALPGAPRPPPAGPARRDVPRPGDDQRRRVHDRPRLPPGRDARQRPGARHQPPLLQRQQPGRDHGWRPDRGRRRTSPGPRSGCRR